MNIKKLLSAALSLTLVCAVPQYTVSTGSDTLILTADAADTNYLTISGDTVTRCDTKAEGLIEIPESVDGVEITKIGDYAFSRCTKITSVKLPETIKELGYGSFQDCSKLAEINLPEGLTSISADVFNGCNSLSAVSIPSTVTSIGMYAFAFTKITDVVLSEKCKTVGLGAFSDCTNMKTIKIYNESCNIVGDERTFSDSSKYVRENENSVNYDIEYNLSIPIYGYENSTAQSYAEKYGRDFEVLRESSSDDNEYTTGTLGYFKYRKYKTGIAISGTTGPIEGKVVIPETIEGVPVLTIYPDVFKGQNKITSISLPSSVKNINESALNIVEDVDSYIPGEKFSALESITVSPNNPYFTSKDGVLYDKELTALIAYPSGKNGDFTVPSSVTEITPHAFDYSLVTSVILPEGIEKIPDFGFYRCFYLKSVELPDSLISIGEKAFAYDGLESVVIPKNCTRIGDFGFFYNKDLKTITFLNPNCVIDGDWQTISNVKGKLGYEFTGVFRGYSNSSAKKYADGWNYKFESIDNNPEGQVSLTTTSATTTTSTTSKITTSKATTTTATSVTTSAAAIATETQSTTVLETTSKITQPTTTSPASTAQSTTLSTTTQTTALSASGADSQTSTVTTSSLTGTVESSVSTTTSAISEDILYGDANVDGKVSIADATAILQFIANRDKYKLTDKGFKNADCFAVGDGVTAKDALAIQQLDAMMIDKLPI